jgi:uncharacterized protein YjbI with pentapeptide repeats
MDPDELDLARSELELHQAEYKSRRREFAESQKAALQSQRVGRLSLYVTACSILVSALLAAAAIVVSSNWSRNQLQTNQKQFSQSLSRSEYNEIINELSSSTSVVQVNALRRLTQFVHQASNFDGSVAAQDQSFVDAIQILQAFIKSASPFRSTGLVTWNGPQSDVVNPALAQLESLAGDVHFGSHDVDLSHTDLRRVQLGFFAPHGNLFAQVADFRAAELPYLRLNRHATFAASFLTCADLTNARLSDASLEDADLSGANLRGADLSRVQGLTSDQVAHALISSSTRFPPRDANTNAPFKLPTRPWLAHPGTCAAVLNQMNGMLPGEGYSATSPCPAAGQAASVAMFCDARATP